MYRLQSRFRPRSFLVDDNRTAVLGLQRCRTITLQRSRRCPQCQRPAATQCDESSSWRPVEVGNKLLRRAPRNRNLKPVLAGNKLISRELVSESLSDEPAPTANDFLKGRFMLPAEEVQEALEQLNVPIDTFLQMLIQPASHMARPAISSFYVGCAAICESGAVYVGVNLEFKGLPLNNSVHAEQCLLVNLIHHDEHELTYLAVTVAPCGHCRQFYSELSCAERVQFIFGSDRAKRYTLSDLLPARFGPSDLLPDPNAPLLLKPQNNPVELTPASLEWLSAWPSDSAWCRAAQAALEEARSCYTPYTGCPAGVALVLDDGRVFGGGCLESAAYNPTLPPMQAAIVELVVHRVPSYDQVREVVLVELDDVLVSHADTTELMLRHNFPNATLKVLGAQRSSN